MLKFFQSKMKVKLHPEYLDTIYLKNIAFYFENNFHINSIECNNILMSFLFKIIYSQQYCRNLIHNLLKKFTKKSIMKSQYVYLNRWRRIYKNQSQNIYIYGPFKSFEELHERIKEIQITKTFYKF